MADLVEFKMDVGGARHFTRDEIDAIINKNLDVWGRRFVKFRISELVSRHTGEQKEPEEEIYYTFSLTPPRSDNEIGVLLLIHYPWLPDQIDTITLVIMPNNSIRPEMLPWNQAKKTKVYQIKGHEIESHLDILSRYMGSNARLHVNCIASGLSVIHRRAMESWRKNVTFDVLTDETFVVVESWMDGILFSTATIFTNKE